MAIRDARHTLLLILSICGTTADRKDPKAEFGRICLVFQPPLRIESGGVFEDLKAQFRDPISVGKYLSDLLVGGHTLAAPHKYLFQPRINGQVLTVFDDYGTAEALNERDPSYFTFKNSLYFLVLLSLNVDTVVLCHIPFKTG